MRMDGGYAGKMGRWGIFEIFVWVMWNDTYCLRVLWVLFSRKLSPYSPQCYQPKKDNIFQNVKKRANVEKAGKGLPFRWKRRGKSFPVHFCGLIVSRPFLFIPFPFLFPFFPCFPFPCLFLSRILITRTKKARIYRKENARFPFLVKNAGKKFFLQIQK